MYSFGLDFNQLQLKLDYIYKDFQLRGLLDSWKEIFNNDYLYSDELTDWLLDYLLLHYFLPKEVWIYLNDKFQIISYMEKNIENYPPGFVEYVKFYHNNDFYIRFDLMEYRDTTVEIDVDQYIRQIQLVERELEENDVIHAQEDFDVLQSLGVVYPREYILEVVLLDLLGEKDEAYEKAIQLYSLDLDAFSLNKLGHIFWKNGNKDRAYSCWKASEENFNSLYCLSRYAYENGEIHEAKEILMRLFEQQQTDQGYELMCQINQKLIDEKRLNISLLDDKEEIDRLRLEVAALYMQNEDYDEALEHINLIEENDNNAVRIHASKAKILYVSSAFEEALVELRTWIQLLDQPNSRYDNLTERPQAVFLYGSCLCETGNDEMAITVLTSIMSQLIEQEVLSANSICATASNHLKKYEEAISFSTEALKIKADYLPAIVEKMHAELLLKQYQAVIDDFDQTVRIYQDVPEIYYYAMKAFISCNQFEDAGKIFEAYNNHHVAYHDDVEFLRLILQRNHSTDTYEVEELIRSFQALLDKKMITDISEIEYEIAYSYYQIDQYTKAYTYINKALKHNPNHAKYMYIKADILRLQEKYNRAIKCYQAVENEYQQTVHYYRNLGLCYEMTEDMNLALDNYLRTVEIDENYHEMDFRISRIYFWRYQDSYRAEDYENALRFAKMYVEYEQSNAAYYNVGIIYLEKYENQKALEQFEKALECDSNDWWTHNIIGYTYNRMDCFKEAISYFEKAWKIVCEKEEYHVRPLVNLAKTYEILKDYSQAIHYLKEAKKYDKDAVRFRTIGQLYQYDNQIETAIQYYQLDDQNVPYVQLKLGDCYFLLDEKEKEEACLEKALYLSRNSTAEYEIKYEYAYRLATQEFVYEKALDIVEELENNCEKIEIDRTQQFKTYLLHARIYYMQGVSDKAKEYGELALKALKQISDDFDTYLNQPKEYVMHHIELAECYIYCGRVEEAVEIFSEVKKYGRCSYCTKQKCYESYYKEGLIYLNPIQSDIEKALELYEEAHSICPYDLEVIAMIRYLKEKKQMK